MRQIERLKKFKEDSKWSNMRLAVGIGVHYATVSAWMRDVAVPSDMANEKIERFLNTQALTQVGGV